jgi:hypothetical protein
LDGSCDKLDVLHTVNDRNIPHTIIRRYCLLKHVLGGKIEGRIDVKVRRWRRRKQLLGDLQETVGYCTLNEEALDCTVWRSGFGRVCGPAVRQTTEMQ